VILCCVNCGHKLERLVPLDYGEISALACSSCKVVWRPMYILKDLDEPSNIVSEGLFKL